jgi:3-oxoadipate enol-lactonase
MATIKNNPAIFQKGDKNNSAIVFCHGFPFNHNMWDKQVEFFSKEYFCVTYDIRGLGESHAGDGQFTMEMFTDDLFYVIKELNLRKPVLCGLSMGGYIALRAVEKNQDLFSTLILCDTKSEADNNETKLKRALGIKTINEQGVENFINEFVPNCFAEETIKNKKEAYEETLSRALKSSSTGAKGCLLAMAGRTDTTEFLPKITMPALILCGEKDRLTPPDTMKEMADKIPGAEFHIVPGAGHLSPLENHVFVNEVTRRFLVRIWK